MCHQPPPQPVIWREMIKCSQSSAVTLPLSLCVLPSLPPSPDLAGQVDWLSCQQGVPSLGSSPATSLISRQSQEGAGRAANRRKVWGHLTGLAVGGSQRREERVRRELLVLKLLQWRQPEYQRERERGEQ